MIPEHLKYGLPMSSDHVRNHFYKQMLGDHVKGKVCFEVGFGSGILSLMALDCGAKFIVAYEGNEETYKLGKHVIEQLELTDKISLHHGYVTTTDIFDQYPDVEVVFSENIDGSLWNEDILDYVLPNRTTPVFLPQQYFVEAYTLRVDKNFAEKLVRDNPLTYQNLQDNPNSYFNPGVDFSNKFVDVINNVLGTGSPAIEDGLHVVDLRNYINDVINMYDVDNMLPKNFYIVDINETSVRTNATVQPLTTDVVADFNISLDPGENCLVLFRAGIAHNNKKLYIDTAHWGAFPKHALVVNADADLNVKHYFSNGSILFEYKDTLVHAIRENGKDEKHVTPLSDNVVTFYS